MKTFSQIKRNINKINQYCEESGLSIVDYLKMNNFSIADFCLLIGMDHTLLNDVLYNTLQILLNDKTTRIYYNVSASSLIHDEISLYSPMTKINISYLEDKVKVIWDKSIDDDNYLKNNSEFMAIKKDGSQNTAIHFALQTVALKNLANERIITSRYPLEFMQLDISYLKYLIDGTILEEKANQVVINKEMIAKDLEKILGFLYNFNYDLAISILKLYPASDKKISDKAIMNNFLNR